MAAILSTPLPPAHLLAPRGASSPDRPPEGDLRAACREFESLFLALLLEQMQATVPKDGLLSSGAAGDIFNSFWAQEVARAGAHSSPLGIGDLLMASFERSTPTSPTSTPKALSTYDRIDSWWAPESPLAPRRRTGT